MTTNLHGTGRQLALLQIGFKLIAALLMVLLLVLEHALGVPLVLALVRQVSEQAAWVFALPGGGRPGRDRAGPAAGALAAPARRPACKRPCPSPSTCMSRRWTMPKPPSIWSSSWQLRLLGHLPDYLPAIDAARGVSQWPCAWATARWRQDEFLAVLMHNGQDRQGYRMLNL